jgi:hypothetical protein
VQQINQLQKQAEETEKKYKNVNPIRRVVIIGETQQQVVE